MAVKTLGLPLGGSKGVRIALQVLIELMLVADQGQNGLPKDVSDLADDPDGSATLSVLKKSLNLVRRLTGNEGGSLGLHPAVYFYGPTGRHSSAMFMGTVKLISRKLSDNNKEFFRTFSEVRSKLETILVDHKDLMATILQKNISSKRVDRYANPLDQMIAALAKGRTVLESDLVILAGLDGKIVTGNSADKPKKFSNDAKSHVFIQTALASAVKCPICHGYMDPAKSVSYDHMHRVQDGGTARLNNLQLTHPYCNQSIKS